MSPEMLLIHTENNIYKFNPEKSDLFSLGITFIKTILLLNRNYISELND